MVTSLTFSLPRLLCQHLQTVNKNAKFESFKHPSACLPFKHEHVKGSAPRMLSVDSKFLIGLENILFAGVRVCVCARAHFSAQTFYRLGQRTTIYFVTCFSSTGTHSMSCAARKRPLTSDHTEGKQRVEVWEEEQKLTGWVIIFLEFNQGAKSSN